MTSNTIATTAAERSPSPRPPRILARSGLLLLTLALSACGPGDPPAAKKAPPEHLVETQPVRMTAVNSDYQRTGSLRARRLVRIFNQEEGRILELPWFEGDQVKEGEVLVRLDDALLSAELAKARATTRQARQDVTRLEGLVKKRAASEDELTRARTALNIAEAEERLLDTRLGYTRITAPFDGVVSERLVETGDAVARHSHLLTFLDPRSLVIELPASELLLPHVRQGDAVQVQIDALGYHEFTGHIQRIHPAVDRITRKGVIEVGLDPIPEQARPGQFARVTLRTAGMERIMIPFTALRHDRDGAFVYLLDDAQKAHRQSVETGIRIADRVEVPDGLAVGQTLITRGFLGLTHGKSVTRAKPEQSTSKTD